MKSYCKNCTSLQPSSFRLENEALTGVPYEDLCCDTCHFIVATVQEREARETLAQPDAFEQGRQEGMKQERALRTLTKLGQEIEAQPEQGPVDFASLLREAEEIVQSKPTWKRFIDGTPLANDIAVWMVVFAQDVARHTRPPQRPWVGLTIYEMDGAFDESMKVRPKEASNAETRRLFARAIEAKLKEKNT